jgi:TolB protein
LAAGHFGGWCCVAARYGVGSRQVQKCGCRESRGKIVMKYPVCSMLLLSAVIVILVGTTVGRGETKPDKSKLAAKQSKTMIVGGWQAVSVSMLLHGGERKTLTGKDGTVSAIISDKKFTLHVGDTVIADMSYVLNPTQSPCAIDLKSPEGAMLGICARDGDELKISLNDEALGRPGDFDKEKNGMVLVLRQFSGQPLFVQNADGSDLRQLPATPEFLSAGSPEWSHGGSKIAFDAWRSVLGENSVSANIFTVNADGSSPRNLGPGAMPSWSPDDKQLTYCEYSPNHGVWIMNADGSDRRLIASEGWGSEWSPTRNEIAYTVYEESGAVLCIYDVIKNQRRKVLHKAYSQIYWGLAWSPDGNWICFKGILPDGGRELAVVSADGEKKGFKVLLPSSALPEVNNSVGTMAWDVTGKKIFVAMKTETDSVRQIYVLDFTGVKPPQLFRTFPADWPVNCMAWSPDGKKMVISANPPTKRKKPEPYLLTPASSPPPDNEVRKSASLFVLIDVNAVTTDGLINYDSSAWRAVHDGLKKAVGPSHGKQKLHARFFFARGVDPAGLAPKLEKHFRKLVADLDMDVVCTDVHVRNDEMAWDEYVRQKK